MSSTLAVQKDEWTSRFSSSWTRWVFRSLSTENILLHSTSCCMDLPNAVFGDQTWKSNLDTAGETPSLHSLRSVCSEGIWRKLVGVAVMATCLSVRVAVLGTFTSGLLLDLMVVTCSCFSFWTFFSPKRAEHGGWDLWLKACCAQQSKRLQISHAFCLLGSQVSLAFQGVPQHSF